MDKSCHARTGPDIASHKNITSNCCRQPPGSYLGTMIDVDVENYY